jgi:hypothetical protein
MVYGICTDQLLTDVFIWLQTTVEIVANGGQPAAGCGCAVAFADCPAQAAGCRLASFGPNRVAGMPISTPPEGPASVVPGLNAERSVASGRKRQRQRRSGYNTGPGRQGGTSWQGAGPQPKAVPAPRATATSPLRHGQRVVHAGRQHGACEVFGTGG